MHPLRNILNKLIWDERESLEDYEIIYVHRGAEGGLRRLRASRIAKVGKSWFSFREGEEETVIPFHRVAAVIDLKTGREVWRRR